MGKVYHHFTNMIKSYIKGLLYILFFIPYALYGQYSIYGTIRIQDSNKPIPNVSVKLLSADGLIKTTTSDENGHFLFSGDYLKKANYMVSIQDSTTLKANSCWTGKYNMARADFTTSLTNIINLELSFRNFKKTYSVVSAGNDTAKSISLYTELIFKVIAESGSVKNLSINLKRVDNSHDNLKTESIQYKVIDTIGHFKNYAETSIKFPYHSQYIISFSEKGYSTKQILIDTSIPAEMILNDSALLKVNVILLKRHNKDESTGVKPFAKIYYNKEADKFDCLVW